MFGRLEDFASWIALGAVSGSEGGSMTYAGDVRAVGSRLGARNIVGVATRVAETLEVAFAADARNSANVAEFTGADFGGIGIDAGLRVYCIGMGFRGLRL